MTVKHRAGSYQVEEASLREALDSYPNALIVTDENLLHHWGDHFKDRQYLAVPAGEGSKSLETFGQALEWLANIGARRSDTVMALGGGVVGDLGGFVASSYMRGIELVQVATTLLAMVDSSIGGKVGIDLPQGKNLVGAFYPPSQVWLCFDALSTLPLREFNNGAAEIWKYGAILDEGLLAALEDCPLGTGDERLSEVVMRCVNLKRMVVEQDELETTGLRAVLNFGHTAGHALERVTGYGAILHGECVAIGMVIEARIGEQLGITPKGAAERLAKGLASQGLPTRLPQVSSSAVVEAMRLDKKASGRGLAFALLTGYGSCKLVTDVPEPVVLGCLQEHL